MYQIQGHKTIGVVGSCSIIGFITTDQQYRKKNFNLKIPINI